MVDDTSRALIAKCQFCGKLNRVEAARVADLPKCGECGTSMRLDQPLKVTDRDFDQIIEGTDIPILVDFYADWCGPCRTMATTLDDFAAWLTGRALVLKLDTHANPVVPQRFTIRGIPTLIAFRDGEEAGRHVGLADRRVMEALAGDLAADKPPV